MRDALPMHALPMRNLLPISDALLKRAPRSLVACICLILRDDDTIKAAYTNYLIMHLLVT